MAYWQEHPNRPKELEEEIENTRQAISQNNAKIKELNQQCKVAEAECDHEPIPAIAEKERLQQKIKILEDQKATLGFFHFAEKKQAIEEYDKVQKDEPRQIEKKKEKKGRVTKEYQKKVEQLKKENERLGKKLSTLSKERDNPLGLDPL